MFPNRIIPYNGALPMQVWSFAAGKSGMAGEAGHRFPVEQRWRPAAARTLGSQLLLCDLTGPDAYYLGIGRALGLETGGEHDVLVVSELSWFGTPLALQEAGTFLEPRLNGLDASRRSALLAQPFRRISLSNFGAILCKVGGSLPALPQGLAEAALPFETVPSNSVDDLAKIAQTVLEAYGSRCAFTGASLPDWSADTFDIALVPIRPLAKGGALTPTNMLPAAPAPRDAFMAGSLSVGRNKGLLLALDRVDPHFLSRLNRSRRLAEPEDPALAPDETFLRYHRTYIFGG